MNAHFHNTTPPANAKAYVSAVDLTQVGVGSCVYVSAHGATGPHLDAEGMQHVTAIEGDELIGDTGDRFIRAQIVEHLQGVIIHKGRVTSNDTSDSLLIALGAELVDLVPKAEALWAAASLLRPAVDKLVAEAERTETQARHGEIWDRISTMTPEGIAWCKAIDRFNRGGGNRVYMLVTTVNRCRAHTPLGMYYRAYALYREIYNEGGIGAEPSDDTFMVNLTRSLLEDAEAVAARIDPPKATGTLAELIETHRASWLRFGDCIDANDAAEDALKALHAKASVLTPVRIRHGKVVARYEVQPDDADSDRAEIHTAHSRWAAEFNLPQVEVMSQKAAKMIRDEIDASLAECLRVYDTETLPKLAALRAPFAGPMQDWQDANDAEVAAFDELVRYRPTSVAEVAQMARYLQTTSQFDAMMTSEPAERWLATLSTLDTEG